MSRFDKFVIYESKLRGKHVIDYDRKLATTKEILIIIIKLISMLLDNYNHIPGSGV